MASPPKIPNLLPADQVTIYFVTFCTSDRRAVLANRDVFERFEMACQKLGAWKALAGVVMPDHIHILLAPLNRDLLVKNAVAGLKRWTRSGIASWSWQQGCFDRLLRSDESAQQKWEYMRENPVRAGLVETWEQWPYRLRED